MYEKYTEWLRMEEVLQNLDRPYLPYDYLVDLYKDLSQPRHKIKKLVDKGDLIPIKRELYLLAPKYKKMYSKETLANMIYGPSLISFEYALAYHNLIPERVENVTCVCFKRNKEFHTPVGTFIYKYMPKKIFSLGVELKTDKLGNFFMATPERALCDIVYHQKLSMNEIESFVVENLRIEREDFLSLNTERLILIAEEYKKSSVMNLVKTQITLKGN
jgi:predicted transcriptional regulator of viral defense system